MQFDIRKSGLAVPHEKPKSERQYGLLEIRNDERRELAKAALSQLWDAMDLSNGGAIVPPSGSREVRDSHSKLYRYLGEALLGDECPEKEVKC